jgi:hypothetical protein
MDIKGRVSTPLGYREGTQLLDDREKATYAIAALNVPVATPEGKRELEISKRKWKR